MGGKMAGRPMLQDLVKAAMVESAGRVSVTEEARRQEKTGAEEKCAKCGKEKEKCACGGKMASALVESEAVEKLASAVDFVAELLKQAANLAGPFSLSEHLQTNPPGVSHATASQTLPDHKGEGKNHVPMHPPMQKDLPAERGKTQMEDNMDEDHHLHAHQMQNNNVGKKTASIAEMVRAKLAADEVEKKETEGLETAKKGLEEAEKAHKSEPENKKEGGAPSLADYMGERVKAAEDAINPAKISAGAAVAPETMEAGQAPKEQPAGGAPNGPRKYVASIEAAIKATKGETHGHRRAELKKYFSEPALTKSTDRTLQVAFDNTGKAGPKIASAAPAASVKTAAARVLLSKLAEDIDEKKGATGRQPGAA